MNIYMWYIISSGVIEGSEEALSYHTRYVDSRGYTELSHRRHHVFSNKRDKLYALFESYLRLKRARGEFDSADRWASSPHFLKLLADRQKAPIAF